MKRNQLLTVTIKLFLPSSLLDTFIFLIQYFFCLEYFYLMHFVPAALDAVLPGEFLLIILTLFLTLVMSFHDNRKLFVCGRSILSSPKTSY